MIINCERRWKDYSRKEQGNLCVKKTKSTHYPSDIFEKAPLGTTRKVTQFDPNVDEEHPTRKVINIQQVEDEEEDTEVTISSISYGGKAGRSDDEVISTCEKEREEGSGGVEVPTGSAEEIIPSSEEEEQVSGAEETIPSSEGGTS